MDILNFSKKYNSFLRNPALWLNGYCRRAKAAIQNLICLTAKNGVVCPLSETRQLLNDVTDHTNLSSKVSSGYNYASVLHRSGNLLLLRVCG